MKQKQIGNLLILCSICLLVSIYFPFFLAFFPSPNYILPTTNYYISIPKINAVAPIISNVDPWNEAEYKQALQKGVAAANFNENFLFAHSSLSPWEMTRTNTAFLRLGELGNGDQIDLYRDGKFTKYYVYDKKEVWPNETAILNQEKDVLILQTCTPIGTSLKRLLVFAKP